MNTSCEPHVNGFYDQRPRWAGAPRRRESNALAGYTTGPSSKEYGRWCTFTRAPSIARWLDRKLGTHAVDVPLGSSPTKPKKPKKTFRVGGPQSPFSISSSFILSFVLLPFFLNTKMNTSCEPHVNGFYDQRPRWAGASEPRCTSSQPGLLTVGHLSPSPIGNLDPCSGRSRERGWRCIIGHTLLRMVRWCIRLTRLTLVCEVIRYRLVQVRQNQKKTFRVGGPQSPFSISSSFILSFVLLPFFLNTKMNTSCEPHVNGFYDQRPRWAGASEPRCTSSQPGLLTVGHLSPSPIGNLDPCSGRSRERGWRCIIGHTLLRMVRWCIRLTRLTLVCEVIRYRLVQVRQNQKKTFRVGGPQSPFSISSSFILSFVLLPFFLNTKMNTSCEPHVNGFYDQRPRWAGASEPRCTSSQPGLLTVGHLSPSPIGNLDPCSGRSRERGWRCIIGHTLLRMVRWCIRLTRLTLVCEVIRYRLVQVRQNQKKTFRVGGPQSPFSISSSFILSFVLLPFFLNTKMNTSCEPHVNGFYDQRPRWAGASEPRCTSSQPRITYCWTSFSISDRKLGPMQWTIEGARVKVHHRPILFWGWSGGVSG